MPSRFRLSFLLPALLLSAAAQAVSTGFFSGPAVPRNLDPQGLYPQGQRMYLGAYSPADKPSRVIPWLTGMERLAGAGFTVAGPDYSADPENQFAKCRAAAKLGLRFAVQCPQPDEIKVAPVAGDEVSKDLHPLNDRPQRMAALPEVKLREHVRAWMDRFLLDPELDAAVVAWAMS